MEKIRSVAHEYGIELVGELPAPDTPTTSLLVTRGAQHQEMTAVAASPFTLGEVKRVVPLDFGKPVLALGARITPRNADHLRAAGINYFDEAGNGHLAFGDTLIDVRGRTTSTPEELRKPTKSASLFTEKRSQVIFAIISWPDLLSARLHDLAHAAGVSVSFTQKTLVALEAANYLDGFGSRDSGSLQNIESLIDGWSAAFSSGLGSRENTQTFRGEFDPFALPDDGPPLYVSGEAVAPWIKRHLTWTIYADGIPRDAARAGRWASDGLEPTIFVRQKFWSEPALAPTLGHARARLAPPLLVYADLLTSGDSREREAAQHLRNDNARLRAA
ncbi:type IV toxin-antitoxin system AbiEi family antitoxin [Microbacterium sp. BH-3-3-3]|uniref:type IV toxin-antitoxin system AbiEi family antitoxin n=1 Tax=Microbacterium sp. BH-3-3-3 TaxID=1906742 RepID=UPI00119E0959|nr:type IV toxin-antitoxin system AbiEi family antitoxin [Microbacterium sp. BH-3-3-3]